MAFHPQSLEMATVQQPCLPVSARAGPSGWAQALDALKCSGALRGGARPATLHLRVPDFITEL